MVEEEQSHQDKQKDADGDAKHPHHRAEAAGDYCARIEIGVVTRISGGILPVLKARVVWPTFKGFPARKAFAPCWPRST